MRLYIPRTRTARLQLAFLCLAIASLAYLSRTLIESLTPRLLHPDLGWWNTDGDLQPFIDISQRLLFVSAFLPAMFLLLRMQVFKSILQQRAALLGMAACLAELTILVGRTAAEILNYMYWKRPASSGYQSWSTYHQSAAGWMNNLFYDHHTNWSAILSWFILVLLSAACIAIVCRPIASSPNWTPSRSRSLRLIILPLCMVNLIYLAYVLGEYAFPVFRSDGTTQITSPSVRAVATIRNACAPFLEIAAAIFFAHLAFKPGALHDPSRCDTCDYPLEPSFTICPECGTKRTVPVTE